MRYLAADSLNMFNKMLCSCYWLPDSSIFKCFPKSSICKLP